MGCESVELHRIGALCQHIDITQKPEQTFQHKVVITY